MHRFVKARAGLLLALVLGSGPGVCAQQESGLPAPSKKGPDGAVRDNALNLLCDLLGDEKNLSKLLIIKHASPALKQLVKTISNTAENSLGELKATLAMEPSKRAKNLDLPAGEMAAREAISKTKEHELLHSSGSELEFQLLLTQSEALNYGAHLARVIAENEPDPARARLVQSISQNLQELDGQVLSRLRGKAP